MAAVCHNPAAERHEIPDGHRNIALDLHVDWGDDDLRLPHTKPVEFCSFACLAAWAHAKAEQHDGRVVKDGE